MTDALSLISPFLLDKVAITEITDFNEITSKYALVLSRAEARELVETRSQALRNFGRIEFAGGIIKKLIRQFCNSPFLSQHNYADTLNELLETFYYFKNETLDEIDDDELLTLMKEYFDHSCQGSIELLQNRELEALARNVRYGIRDYSHTLLDSEEELEEELCNE